MFRALGSASVVIVLAVAVALSAESTQTLTDLLTVAEKSDFRATSRHEEVVEFCERLAKASPLVRLGTLGDSAEGRRLPLMILADPPVATAEEAKRSGKLVVFAMANIHAGEVDGKEGLLMLARDLALAKDRQLLKDLILVFAPIFNADGNEHISTDNRRAQNGPLDGVGIRANAQGFDLNRDFVKLESPEVRSLVRFLNTWDPGIIIDCHTTNGSHHRYTLTYEGGRCPAGDARLIAYTRDTLLPQVSRAMEKKTGYRSYFYGNLSAERSRWETVSPTPRYGTHYIGLRNRIAILSESYSYAPYKDRVLASRAFVHGICEYAAEHCAELRRLLAEARDRTIAAGTAPKENDRIVLRHEPVPLGRPVTILGYAEEQKAGRRVATSQPKDFEVQYLGDVKPTLEVQRPAEYLFPAALANVRENLQRHGIQVEETRQDAEFDVQIYRVEKIARQPLFQRHQPVSLEVQVRQEKRKLPAGTLFVRTAQPLGSLAVYLLEPQSADGLATWNFFDESFKEGEDFPVLRAPATR